MSEQHKEAVRRAIGALGEGDVEGFLADVADDFRFTLAGEPPGGNTLQGKKEMVALLRELFGSRLQNGAIPTVQERLIAEGDFVVEQARGRATTVEGEAYDNVYCRVWRFQNGRIAALTEYMDTELARRCLWSGPIADPVPRAAEGNGA